MIVVVYIYIIISCSRWKQLPFFGTGNDIRNSVI